MKQATMMIDAPAGAFLRWPRARGGLPTPTSSRLAVHVRASRPIDQRAKITLTHPRPDVARARGGYSAGLRGASCVFCQL
jgi:hypothetical protein